MKSDISIPNPVFHAAETLARKLGVSLSELYTAAITAYVTEHQKENVTEALNRVLETEPSTVEPEMVKMLVLSIGGEEKKNYPLRGKSLVYRDPLKSVANADQKSLGNISARVPGVDKGKIVIMPDFDAPLSEFNDE